MADRPDLRITLELTTAPGLYCLSWEGPFHSTVIRVEAYLYVLYTRTALGMFSNTHLQTLPCDYSVFVPSTCCLSKWLRVENHEEVCFWGIERSEVHSHELAFSGINLKVFK